MSLYNLILSKTQEYRSTFIIENNYQGDDSYLESIKELHLLLSSEEKKAYNEYIRQNMSTQGAKAGGCLGGVVGMVAMPIADAYCAGGTSIIRKFAMSGLGLFSGYFFGACDASTRVYDNEIETTQYRNSMAFLKIHNKLQLKIWPDIISTTALQLYKSEEEKNSQNRNAEMRRRHT